MFCTIQQLHLGYPPRLELTKKEAKKLRRGDLVENLDNPRIGYRYVGTFILGTSNILLEIPANIDSGGAIPSAFQVVTLR